MDNIEFLYEMLRTPSVSGSEEALQKVVVRWMEQCAKKIIIDEIGDVICTEDSQAPAGVLLTAHADEIGLVVTYITEAGYLHVAKTGGIYAETYLGQKVQVLTKRGALYGCVVEHHTISKKKDLEPKDLLIDIGANSKASAEKAVDLGDGIVFDSNYRELLDGRLSARALDDKIGIFCIMEAYRRTKERGAGKGIYCASTVGEEIGKHGACWVSSRVKPVMAVVVDVTYTSDYSGVDARECGKVELGKGPVLCRNPISHKEINKWLEEAAKRAGVSYQIEVSSGRTCTDADEIHVSGNGVPTALMSIPLRYMHTPGEVCDLSDVENCIRILVEFLCHLPEEIDLIPDLFS